MDLRNKDNTTGLAQPLARGISDILETIRRRVKLIICAIMWHMYVVQSLAKKNILFLIPEQLVEVYVMLFSSLD